MIPDVSHGTMPSMRGVHVAGVNRGAGGPGEPSYTCQPCGSRDLAFLMLEPGNAFWRDDVGRLLREVQTDFHAAFADGPPDLRVWVSRMNGHLRALASGNFCTMFVGVMHTEDLDMEYLSAGHGEAYVRNAGTRQVEELPRGFCLLGVIDESPATVSWKAMNPGNLLLLANSGVAEVVNEEQERFGHDNIKQVLHQEHAEGTTPRAVLRALFQRLDRHGRTCAIEPMALALMLTE